MQIAILSFFHYFSNMFKKRESVFEVEEGKFLSPKFDSQGLIPVITTDSKTGEVLMHGYMNTEALKKTIETKEAHYWSRSRKSMPKPRRSGSTPRRCAPSCGCASRMPTSARSRKPCWNSTRPRSAWVDRTSRGWPRKIASAILR